MTSALGSILLLAMFALTVHSAGADAHQTDRAIDEFTGPVKSVRFEVLEFDTYTGKLDTERMPKLEDWYDRAGNLVEEKYHTPDFIEDKHPQQVDPQTYLLKSNMGDKRRHRVFDPSGKLIEETIYIANDGTWQLLDWTRFKYDVHGRRIEVDDVRDGKVDGLTLMKRDTRGNVVQVEFHYNGNHAPFPCTWYGDYKFDRYGNWTTRRVYEFDPEGGKPKRIFSGVDYQIIQYQGDSKSR